MDEFDEIYDDLLDEARSAMRSEEEFEEEDYVTSMDSLGFTWSDFL